MKNDLKNLKGFLSYAHDDKHYLEVLVKGLTSHSAHNKKISLEFWDDRKIAIGDNWETTITEQIDACDFAILLVSANFFSSDYCSIEELGRFIEKKTAGDFVFFPILVTDCDYTTLEEIAKVQFFSAKGDEYDVLRKKKELIAFADITEFDKNQNAIPNSKRDTFLKNLVKAIELKLEENYLNNTNRKELKTSTKKQFHNYIKEIAQSNPYEKYGLLSLIPPEKFHSTRSRLVDREDIHFLTLTGASLSEALSDFDDNEKSVANIIKRRLKSKNDNLKSVKIFITDPELFDEMIDPPIGKSYKSPISRINKTLDCLVEIGKSLHNDKNLEIIFVPLLQIDHLVVVDDMMIIRNTMLWTGGEITDNTLRGTWMLFSKINENQNSMYGAYSNYLDVLLHNSIKIPLERDGLVDHDIVKKLNSNAILTHYEFRKRIARLDSDNVVVRKIYRNQLITYAFSTFDEELRNYNKDYIWKDENIIIDNRKNASPLIDHYNDILINDSMQKILLPTIRKSEKKLCSLVKHYDKVGFSKIIPTMTFGMPSEEHMFWGGFPKGCFVAWKCGIPLVPIDAMANICTSTYCRVPPANVQSFTQDNLTSLIQQSYKQGLLSWFDRRNHFILLAKSENTHDHYVVMHSSSNEYRCHSHSLHPSKTSWYYNKIKVWQDPGGEQLRYIKDNDALRYMHIAKIIGEYNKEIHKWFATKLCGLKEKIYSSHHNFMPSSSCIVSGAYVVPEKTIVPIFSKFEEKIILFKTNNDWGVRINKKKYAIIPHSWGATVSDEYLTQKKIISLQTGELTVEKFIKDIQEDKKAYLEIIQNRDLTNKGSYNEKLKTCLSGGVDDTLIPIFSFSNEGFVDHR